MKFSSKLFLMAILLLLPVVAGGCTLMDRLEARDHLNKGVSAYTVKKYEEAIEHFQESIRLDPELTTAYLYLATAYRAQFIPGAQSEENKQRADRAIATFQEALNRDPGNSTAMANIAGIYQGLNDHDSAKLWYRKRIEVESSNPEPLYGIGVINWQLSYDRTGVNGENVANLTPEQKAEISQLLDEGIDVMKRALELKPDYHEAMQYLNLLYREQGKLTEDPEERARLQKEADQLALKALEVRKKQEEEAERLRKTFSGAAKKE
ncbi:MAG: tetratricopeptide repeat protein [Acidobacteria bacterium]|nr:tetratricopeptide repeat protein [Acidobacteriota bacterium]